MRLEETELGTLGVLKIDKEVFCCTLEPADRENEVNRSSIPAQQYLCESLISPKYGSTFEVKHVPGRTYILFHSGNVSNHTAGCILLGEKFGKLRGNLAVLNSGATMERFKEELYDEGQVHLTIREVY